MYAQAPVLVPSDGPAVQAGFPGMVEDMVLLGVPDPEKPIPQMATSREFAGGLNEAVVQTPVLDPVTETIAGVLASSAMAISHALQLPMTCENSPVSSRHTSGSTEPSPCSKRSPRRGSDRATGKIPGRTATPCPLCRRSRAGSST